MWICPAWRFSCWTRRTACWTWGLCRMCARCCGICPKKRQTLLFSATMPREIEQLAASILHEPVRVMVTPPATTVEAIRQSVCFVDKGNKKHLLASLLQDKAVTSALVFTRTKHGADRVVRDLAKAGIQAAAIHGNKKPDRASNCADPVQNRADPSAGSHGHRGQGHRCVGAFPRVQLRSAQRAGDLCAPHRPHGPRGCGRCGDQFLLCRRSGVSEGH